MKILSKHTRTRLIWRDGKKVRAHRWIMEQHLGRKLLSNEDVHHINGDHLDNRLENLVVMLKSEHITLHAKEKQIYPDEKNCEGCGKLFKVNPRKRKRNNVCSMDCRTILAVKGRKKQVEFIKATTIL